MLTFSILTFNVCESEVLAPTCKLISFPDISVLVAFLVPIFCAVVVASISCPAVNLILLPSESVIVITEPLDILPSVVNLVAAIPYLLLPSKDIVGLPPLASVLTFISVAVKSSKSNPS